MATVRLFLTGIRASGRHGANEGERDRPQEFVVDLDAEVESSEDDLDHAVDYRALVATARETVANESFVLLETLAGAVADAALALQGVRRVTAVVHKPAAMRSLDVQGVAAAATAVPPPS